MYQQGSLVRSWSFSSLKEYLDKSIFEEENCVVLLSGPERNEAVLVLYRILDTVTGVAKLEVQQLASGKAWDRSSAKW